MRACGDGCIQRAVLEAHTGATTRNVPYQKGRSRRDRMTVTPNRRHIDHHLDGAGGHVSTSLTAYSVLINPVKIWSGTELLLEIKVWRVWHESCATLQLIPRVSESVA